MKIGKIRINMIEDESYYDKENAIANIGESIQAVTISYIYRELGIDVENIVKVDQCRVKEYDGESLIFPLRLPLSRANVDDFFPLNKCITPIFISLHLHDDIFEDREDLIQYFRKFEPIGCRDEQSCSFFLKHGIEAYIMGCYTLCLPKRIKVPEKGHPFIVDASKELLEFIPQDIKNKAILLSQAMPFEEYPITHHEDERLEGVAKCYLQRYYAEADMVITSRLHAAAPCMAMGIPVILASNNIDFRYAWIDKYLKLYQESEYSEINWNPSIPADLDNVRKLLMKFFSDSISKGIPARDCLRELDRFYRDRNKTEYYLCFRKRLEKLKQRYPNNMKFTYAIWGAGCHSVFAYNLMQEMFPNASLQVIVDKYKKGRMYGVPIISREQLDDYHIDHVCITTHPGLNEAIQWCDMHFKEDSNCRYTIITSQQKS